MKKITFLLIFFMAFLINTNQIMAKEKVNIHLFYSKTCPHCKNEIKKLEELEKKYNINVFYYEVSESSINSEKMDKVKKAFKENQPYVPFTTVGTQNYVGYNDNVGKQIEEAIIYYEKNKANDITQKVLDGEFLIGLNTFKVDKIEAEKVKLPILGEINPRDFSLPVIAAVIGTVDGFNPCAMWVLLFLISMLIGMKDKKKMWILGLTFLTTSALIYTLLMVSWLTLSLSMMEISFVRILVALFAIGAGAWNFNKYLKSRKEEEGCDIVSKDERKKTFAKVKKIVNEKSIILSMIGVAVLAVSVNIVELACSAGLPLIFTQILAVNDLNWLQYSTYIFIYILFFLIDDIIIFAIAMKTFELTGVSNKYTKYSTLIGAVIMLIIGLLLIFAPEILMFA